MRRFLGVLCVLAAAVPAMGLEPDQIALVANQNVADGVRLAQFYAQARGIPADRIVLLKVPITEEMSFGMYEREVVPPIREFLEKRGLKDKVTCLVTFYGVPLRVGARQSTPAEREEMTALQAQKTKLLEAVREKLAALEAQAAQGDPTFKPESGDDVERLAARWEAVLRAMSKQITAIEDPAQRSARAAELVQAARWMTGPAGVLKRFGGAGAPVAQTEEGREKLKALAAQVQEIGSEIVRLQSQRNDAQSRARARKLVGEGFGTLELIRVTGAHADYLDGSKSVAALDNELSLLWWDLYPRGMWQANPMNHRFRQMMAASVPPTLMVSRLDAPQAGQVRAMILASLRAEKEGLKGKIVLDSRSIKGGEMGSYGWYDQTIRDLAEIVKGRTKMQLLHDESPGLIPEGSVPDIALYCGWYRLRNYTPPGKYNLGAVGFHVASSELVSLRGDNERGWVHGLLNDGMVASLGPVAEPFLAAFPPADEFFTALLTGKLTLAEVYWRTSPMTSWMISLVGDPLYTPYKANPALKMEDVPVRMLPIFEGPTTRPAGK